MKKRIITGAVLITLCVPIGIYSGTLALPIVVAALSMIGIFEMYRCIGLSGRLPVLLPALLIGGGNTEDSVKKACYRFLRNSEKR